jgi:pimeloyl-ACP methyl ester carboxylesterase
VRFDYSGTGNSSGAFSDITMASLVDDTTAVIASALSLAPSLPVWLIGGRFGATLACLAVASHPQAEGVVLWDPIVDMSSEFRMQFVNRTLLNRKLMLDGQAARQSLEDIATRTGIVELNCLTFNSTFYRELTSLKLDAERWPHVEHLRVFLCTECRDDSESALLTALARRPGVKVERMAAIKRAYSWGAEGFSESEVSRLLARATVDFLACTAMAVN